MARIIYGALATEIKGSIGGTTFQSNAYGKTVKNKPLIRRVNSLSQGSKRRIMVTVSQHWYALDPTYRTNWDAYATFDPQPTKHNLTSYLSGYHTFMKENLLRLTGGLALLDNPVFDTLVLAPLTPYMKVDGGLLYLNITPTFDVSTIQCNMYITSPEKISRKAPVNRYKYLMTQTVQDYEFNIDALYKALFPGGAVVGNTVWLKLVMFGDTTPHIFGTQVFKLTVTVP
jgi:hypothetical protein